VFNLALNTGAALVLNGKGGNDLFNLGANLTKTDTIDGGAGHDMVVISSQNAKTDLDNIQNVEEIHYTGGATTAAYAPADGVIAANQSLIFNASTATGAVKIDFSAEKDGSFTYIASAKGDTITTAANNLSDTIILGVGADTVNLTAGANTVGDIEHVDVIQNFEVGTDTINVAVVPPAGTGTWLVTLVHTSSNPVDHATFLAAVNSALAGLGSGYTGGSKGDAIVVTVTGGSGMDGTYVICDDASSVVPLASTAEVVKLVGLTGGSFSAANFT